MLLWCPVVSVWKNVLRLFFVTSAYLCQGNAKFLVASFLFFKKERKEKSPVLFLMSNESTH